MIIADTSALIEIIVNGPRAGDCMEALELSDHILMSAASMTEAPTVAGGRRAEQPLRDMFEQFGISIEPLTQMRAQLAAAAHKRYGKGWHAASLNFGDCFASALAKEHGCPLLFVGKDFPLTDVTPAIP